MTYEEAISILTKDRALCLFKPMTGDVGPLNEDCRMSAEAMKLAIETLEKQIPKKPIFEREQTSPFGVDDVPYCPNCKCSLPEVSYCEECGQAIDWEASE